MSETVVRRVDALRQPMLLVLDPRQGRDVGGSATAQLMLGYSHSELLALSPREMASGERGPALAAAVAALHRSGRWDGSWRLRRKDGSILHTWATTRLVQVNGRLLYQGVFRGVDWDEAAPPVGSQLAQLEKLSDAHVRAAFGYAYTFLGEHQAAEYAVGEALLSGWRSGMGSELDPDTARPLVLSLVHRILSQPAMLECRRRHRERGLFPAP